MIFTKMTKEKEMCTVIAVDYQMIPLEMANEL